MSLSFFFNDTATTEIYTLPLHDALPIWPGPPGPSRIGWRLPRGRTPRCGPASDAPGSTARAGRPGRLRWPRSEEHTSELQSRQYLVCRLLLEKKNQTTSDRYASYTTLTH